MVEDDELVIPVDGAEYAGETLERESLDVEAHPGAMRAKPGRSVAPQFGS